MKPTENELWDNERRWSYAHTVLGLDAVFPFYRFIGIPFPGAAAHCYKQVVNAYNLQYPADSSTPIPLPEKRRWLLERLQAQCGPEYTRIYQEWLLQLYVFVPREQTYGYAEWIAIFARCAVRTGWWSRLGLITKRSTEARVLYESFQSKLQLGSNEIEETEEKPFSTWDQKQLAQAGVDDESREVGEPFNSIYLTAYRFQFSTFWIQLLAGLSPEELDQLWRSGQQIGQDLKIAAEKIVPPSQLKVDVARWWATQPS